MKRYHALGLMSGSSLDGLDLAYCQLDWAGDQVAQWSILEAATLPFSPIWQRRLGNLPTQSALAFAQTHTYFGRYMGELVQQFLTTHRIEQLDLIASHGHTVFHQPDRHLSVQIGDGAALAALTGYTTLTEFRTQDVALGGEGAPLAPLAEHYLLAGYDFYLNLGGIANVSAPVQGRWVALDCCPANQVLNVLAQSLGADYDAEGAWARSGQVLPELLEQVSNLPYYQRPYPKSLGNGWIREQVLPIYGAAEGSPQDKLATACEHCAIEVAESLAQIIQREGLDNNPYRVLVTGGGAFNTYLLETLQAYGQRHYPIEFYVPDATLVQYKEALLLALLGVLRLEQVPNSWQSVTGAQRDTINGAIYQGWRVGGRTL